MQFNREYAKLAINQIESAYRKGDILRRPGRHGYGPHSEKTEAYLRDHGITFQKALKDAVQALSTSKLTRFRGPSPSYFPGQSDGVVYDFLVPLYDSNMYIKFSLVVRNDQQFIIFESFHESDRNDFGNFIELNV